MAHIYCSYLVVGAEGRSTLYPSENEVAHCWSCCFVRLSNPIVVRASSSYGNGQGRLSIPPKRGVQHAGEAVGAPWRPHGGYPAEQGSCRNEKLTNYTYSYFPSGPRFYALYIKPCNSHSKTNSGRKTTKQTLAAKTLQKPLETWP